MIPTFQGIPIMQSLHCMEDTKERLFPESRHRSARIRKKLLKRFGGEFRKRPAMYQMPNGTIICHPVIYRQLMKIKLNAEY
jgi:hypothetical protein